MATYVPGAQGYFPEFQPFTPDYKFLSGVLDVRTDRYNTNYKAVNDLYSKVIYADLSRQDTRETRDQYANQLTPNLEKISGMDLSIQQNADAANALFKPFYEDNLIVKDLVATQQYKRELSYADNLLGSDDKEIRGKYWQTGVTGLNYQMKDFIDATPQEAVSMGVPKYVPNANLYELSLEILKDSGLKVTAPPTFEGGWIITQTNGAAVTPAAYEMVKRTLLDDPRVINAYHTDAYVKQRQFVDEGLTNKQFANKDQAQTAWANNVIADITKKIAAQMPETKTKTEDAVKIKTNWELYAEQYGIIPGSNEEKAMVEAMSEYDAQVQKQRGQEDLMQEGMQPSPNTNVLLNKAYNMMMSYDIHDDMLAAARTYSTKDASVKVEANPYKVMEATKALEHRYNVMEKILDHDNKMLEIVAEAKAKKEAEGGPALSGSAVLNALDIFGKPTGGANTALDLSKINPTDLNDQYKLERRAESKNAQIDFILNAHQQIASLTKGDPQTMTFNTAKGQVKMTLNQAREYLLKPENAVNNLYKSYSEKLDNPLKTNPLLVAKENGAILASLKEERNLTDALLLKAIVADDEETKVYAESFNKLKQLEQGKVLKEYEEKGIPMIVGKDAYGKNKVLTEREFIEEYKLRYETGRIDYTLTEKERSLMSFLPTEWFKNQSANRRDIKENIRTQAMKDGVLTKTELTNEIIKDAKKLYASQKQVLNSALNGSIASEAAVGGKKVPTFTPWTREQYYRGLRPEEMTLGNLQTYGAYSTPIVPHTLNNDPDAIETLALFNTQYNTSKTKVVVPGDLDGAEELPTASNKSSEAVLYQVMQDLRSIVLDPKSPRTTTPNMTIDYFPVYGAAKGIKNMAAYRIHLDSDYVKKLQSTGEENSKTGVFSGNVSDNNTITVLFPQNEDKNPRRMSNYNFSAVDSKIQMSGNAKYEAPNGGSVNFYKSGNIWMYNMETEKYDPNTGNFVTEDVIPSAPVIYQDGTPILLNDLDRVYNEFVRGLNQKASINISDSIAYKQNVLKNK